MSVVWRPIDGYVGYYEISNTGLVRSVDRCVIKSNGVLQRRCGKIKAQTADKDGYMVVKLSKDGEDTRIHVHTLVARAFVDGYFEHAEVNHKDFDRSNNNAANLEWVTHSYNVQYSIDAGRHICTTDLTGSNNPNYGNHVLKDRYKNNPSLSKEKQGRRGAANGTARAVRLHCPNERQVVFGTIKDCANYMIDNLNINAKVESLSAMISKAIRNNTTCHGCFIEDT